MSYNKQVKHFVKLPKLSKGDQVAIISPSAGLPGLFPWVQDLGLERIKNEFGLIPKEYATTRQVGSTLEDRARDIMSAFSDTENKAVISSIGGDDQIKLLKLLDPEVFLKNPKPYFGYSDNTHLINYFWGLGIPSYYGGSILTQFAMQGGMDDITKKYIHYALFENGEYELLRADMYNDEGLDWGDAENLNKKRKLEKNDPWLWDGTENAEGILWGGCIESLVAQFSVGTFLPRAEDFDNTILFIETAEDLPEPWIVEYVLVGMGERGWFNKFKAVMVGRPKAWEFDKPKTTEEKAVYRAEQAEAVLDVVREYNKTIPVIQNLDFGHTDPQIVLPVGQNVRIDSASKKIFANY